MSYHVFPVQGGSSDPTLTFTVLNNVETPVTSVAFTRSKGYKILLKVRILTNTVTLDSTEELTSSFSIESGTWLLTQSGIGSDTLLFDINSFNFLTYFGNFAGFISGTVQVTIKEVA